MSLAIATICIAVFLFSVRKSWVEFQGGHIGMNAGFHATLLLISFFAGIASILFLMDQSDLSVNSMVGIGIAIPGIWGALEMITYPRLTQITTYGRIVVVCLVALAIMGIWIVVA